MSFHTHIIDSKPYLYFHCRYKGKLYTMYIKPFEVEYLSVYELLKLSVKIKQFYDTIDKRNKKVCIRCDWHKASSVFWSLLSEALSKGYTPRDYNLPVGLKV